MDIENDWNTLEMERVKFVYIMTRDSESKSEVRVWRKITPPSAHDHLVAELQQYAIWTNFFLNLAPSSQVFGLLC